MSEFSQENGFWAVEPLTTIDWKDQVFWEIDNIRFHHPAEHKINDTQYDLEMQIFGNDKFNNRLICLEKAAVSILFKIDDSSEGSDFFDWQENAAEGKEVRIDLEKLLPMTTQDKNNIYGYSGTDTMPGCEHVCWYVLESAQKITTAQRDFFVYESNASNARNTGFGDTEYTTFFFWYGKSAPQPLPLVPSIDATTLTLSQYLLNFLN